MLACKLTSTHLKVKEWSETGIYDSTRYHVLFYTNNIDDVMVDHATIWSNYPQPASGLTLGQIGQMHKLPHKMLTILSHPNCLHFPGFPVSQVCSLYTDVPSIAAVGSCLSRTYRNFEQFQRKMDEVGCKTKIKKINFVPAVYKSENWEVGLILDTENHGNVRCYHDFQIKKKQIKGCREMTMWPVIPTAKLALVSPTKPSACGKVHLKRFVFWLYIKNNKKDKCNYSIYLMLIIDTYIYIHKVGAK